MVKKSHSKINNCISKHKIKQLIDQYLKHYYNIDINEHIARHNNSNDEACYLLAILFYLFSRNCIDINNLPMPRNDTIVVQKGGTIRVFDRSGPLLGTRGSKRNRRLLYQVYHIVEGNEINRMLKVTTPAPSFITESNIYQELNNTPEISTRVLTIYNAAYINLVPLQSLTFNLGLDNQRDQRILIFSPNNIRALNTVFFPQTYNEIIALGNNKYRHGQIHYIVTEYAIGYMTLNRAMHGDVNTTNKYILTVNLIRMLIYLNQKYGYVHWNLHGENLFVDRNLNYKLFDFDLSSTDRNRNNELFIRCRQIAPLNYMELKIIGLLYDVFRFTIALGKLPDCCGIENVIPTCYRLMEVNCRMIKDNRGITNELTEQPHKNYFIEIIRKAIKYFRQKLNSQLANIVAYQGILTQIPQLLAGPPLPSFPPLTQPTGLTPTGLTPTGLTPIGLTPTEIDSLDLAQIGLNSPYNLPLEHMGGMNKKFNNYYRKKYLKYKKNISNIKKIHYAS